MLKNRYYEWRDGFFTYFINVETGKKKFKLEDGDVLVEHDSDDFSR